MPCVHMVVIPSHGDWLKDADITSVTLLLVLQHNSTCQCVCRPLSEDVPLTEAERSKSSSTDMDSTENKDEVL